MRNQLAATLALCLLSLLLSGCIEQKEYPGGTTATLFMEKSYDIDQDGMTDVYEYTFNPTTASGAGLKATKQITVAVDTSATYTDFAPLTDLGLLVVDSDLEEFGKSMAQSHASCAQKVGLLNVNCIDARTCSKLCSSASVDCKRIAEEYEDVLGWSMIGYIKDSNDMNARLLEARRASVKLRSEDEAGKNEYLGKLRSITYSIASTNANPLFTQRQLQLCAQNDYGVQDLVKAAKAVGNYTVREKGYKYTVTVFVDGSEGAPSQSIMGLGINDVLPGDAVGSGGDISSAQQITVVKEAGVYRIDWLTQQNSPQGYLLEYEFYSTQPPKAVINRVAQPGLDVRSMNLGFIGPVNGLVDALVGVTGSYYMGIGAALAVIAIALLVAYNVLVLLYHVASAGKDGPMAGVRRAIGRTEVRWKTDLVLSVLLLAAAFYLSNYQAPKVTTPPSLMESADFLLNNPFGVAAVSTMFLGLLLLFTAIENRLKIAVLERVYGAAIKEEKATLQQRVAQLKAKMAELDALIKQDTAEEFDVGGEYDVLAAISTERVDELAKSATPRSKKMVEEYLNRVEAAVESLHERKKMADENWAKWGTAMGKMLEDQGEVHVSSLVTIPASLRGWAVGRYAKEHGPEGVVLEGDALRKKKVAPEKVVDSMVRGGMIRTVVAIKGGKVVLAQSAKGSATVPKVMAIKLHDYLKTLAKSLGQSEWTSLAAVGDKNVLVVMKEDELRCTLVVPREKFKEAIESFKSKAKALCG